MEQVTLAVEIREQKGKNNNRRLRAAGKVPGVLYGSKETYNLALDPRVVTAQLLKEGGTGQIMVLQGPTVDGKKALLKDWQVDPLSRRLVHVDLLEVDATKKVAVQVKLNFTGKAAGVADGGVLNIVVREIDVRCLIANIPSHIDVDVTALTIGDSLHLNDIKMPEGVEAMSHKNDTLVTVVPPTKEEEAAPVLTQSAEPVVLTEKKKEGDAAAPAAEGAKDEKKK